MKLLWHFLTILLLPFVVAIVVPGNLDCVLTLDRRIPSRPGARVAGPRVKAQLEPGADPESGSWPSASAEGLLSGASTAVRLRAEFRPVRSPLVRLSRAFSDERLYAVEHAPEAEPEGVLGVVGRPMTPNLGQGRATPWWTPWFWPGAWRRSGRWVCRQR